MDYSHEHLSTRREKHWWRNQKWNKPSGDRSTKIEAAFFVQDEILKVSSSFNNCYEWLTKKGILQKAPSCEICGHPMAPKRGLGGFRNADGRAFHCSTCLTKSSLRYQSFLAPLHCTLQEFHRVCFHYFVRGYDPELALRELNENAKDATGVGICRSAVHSIFALARERISRLALDSIKGHKFGG